MPFTTLFCNSCLFPADSSIISSVPPRRSSSSLKTILRQHLFKKRTSVVQDHRPRQLSTRTPQRTKRSDIIRKFKSNGKSHSTWKNSHNYDMSILHNDELENTHLATVRRRKKKIPAWANHDQLQLAIINQVYFQDQNPEDIFGTVCIEHIFEMINSIDMKNKQPTTTIVSRHFV